MPLQETSRILLACTAIGVIACCGGCGARHVGVVPVSGVVTIDGEPLPLGQLRVLAKDHRPAMGRIQEDGSFRLSCFDLGDGAPEGTHLVTITAVESVNEHTNRWHAPKKYANEVTSGLWATIDGATDDLKIDLSWEGSGHSAPFLEKF